MSKERRKKVWKESKEEEEEELNKVLWRSFSEEKN